MSSRKYAESSWTSGLERATGSSSSTEAWENRVDEQGRLFYVESSLEPNWKEIKVTLPVDSRRGNLGRKAGLSERLLGIRVGRGAAIESNVGVEDLVQEGDVIHRVDGIPVQDRAGVEMTLSGISPGTQSVVLHVLRKSRKVEDAETPQSPKPAAFSHLLLYFHPGAREIYKFPGSPAPLSAAFPTLHDALNNSFNSGAVSTTITFNGTLHSVSYAQLESGLLCVAISQDIVPGSYIRPLVDQLRRTIQIEFGQDFDALIDTNTERISSFFNRFFHSVLNEPIESRAFPLPRLLMISEQQRNKIETVLYRYEACELEDGAYVRTHHILGSAVFFKDNVVCSHMEREHLELIFLLIRQERMFTSDIARIIVWRPIYLPDSTAANFLIVISRGVYAFASILEVNSFCINDGTQAPDPFLIDWADENLSILRNILLSPNSVAPVKDYLVIDDARGFFVGDVHDAELWNVYRKRRGTCSSIKTGSSYLSYQLIDNVVVINRQETPFYTIEEALKAIRNIIF